MSKLYIAIKTKITLFEKCICERCVMSDSNVQPALRSVFYGSADQVQWRCVFKWIVFTAFPTFHCTAYDKICKEYVVKYQKMKMENKILEKYCLVWRVSTSAEIFKCRFTIWCKQCESMDLFCLILMVQAGVGVKVWGALVHWERIFPIC